MLAWRVCKARYPAYDGTGAMLWGARWTSPGRAVIYAADSFAGAILEILAHASRPRTLPREPHHGIEIDIPDGLIEGVDPAAVPGWEAKASRSARAFGDAWLAERRSAALQVPALSCRPMGRNLLINPAHPDAARITPGPPFLVPWDERLF